MPLLADRVQETTTTGGTGTLTLGGAVTGYRTFAASFSVGNVLFYTIDNGAGEWEIGIGTLVTSGTLSRDTVIESSNSNALVNFSSGTKRVFCSAPTQVLLPNQTSNSGKVLTTDGSNPSWTSTLNSVTIGNLTPGSGAFTTLSASSTVSGTGFSTYLASPPAIGGTTPAAGNFTTLGATGNVTLGDASGDTVTFNAATVTLNNSTTISAASTKTLTLNGGAGSNGLVLDASNNVGIGTGTPGAKLDIAGNANIKQFVSAGNGTTNGYLGYSWNRNLATGALFDNAKNAYDLIMQPGSNNLSLEIYAPGGGVVTGSAVVFDSSGNLGLGVTPSAWGSSYKALEIGGTVSYLSAASQYIAVYANAYRNSSGTNVYTTSGVATAYVQDLGAHKWYNAPSGTAGNAISFTQAMTLDASGNLLVGTTSLGNRGCSIVSNGSGFVWEVQQTGGAGTSCQGITYSASSPNNSSDYFLYCIDSTTARANIRSNGGLANYSANNVNLSDERVKTDITPAPLWLTKINAIEVVNFKYKDQTHDDPNLGVIAQQVLSVAPELVDEDGFGETPEDGVPLMAIFETDLKYAMLKAIQELSAELNELKAKVNA